jgi:hypothetical protein
MAGWGGEAARVLQNCVCVLQSKSDREREKEREYCRKRPCPSALGFETRFSFHIWLGVSRLAKVPSELRLREDG